jgi:hypothetical protein
VAVIAYLLALTLGGGAFWTLWKLLGFLRRRGRWGYYLAAVWAGAVGGLVWTSAFYLTGQADVLFDGPYPTSRREVFTMSVTFGILLGLGLAWYATWQPSALNMVDGEEGPWTAEFVKEIMADAERASPERRRQIAEQIREMARDSKSKLPAALEHQVVQWEGDPRKVRRAH